MMKTSTWNRYSAGLYVNGRRLRPTPAAAILPLFLLLADLSAVPVRSETPAQSDQIPSSTVSQARVINLAEMKEILAQKHPENLTLVNFWATWCDPCVEEMPDLVKLADKYKGKGLIFLSISADHPDDLKERVQPFVEKMNMSFPVYVVGAEQPDDLIKAVDTEWQGSLPATFLYDRQGTKLKVWYEKVTFQQLDQEIEKYLSLLKR